MADNPYVNKVEYGGETLMDLTGDTATAADVVKGKTFHLASGAPAVGDGTFDAIIDVTELPVEDIEENVFYRLVDGYFVYNKAKVDGWTTIFVETLPSVGQPVTTDMVTITAYYSLSDGEAYGYIDEALSSMASIPVGWYPLDAIATAFDVAYGGVISNISDATEEDTTYLLLDCKYCAYKDGWRYFVGGKGAGDGAEVFNSPENEASGDYSHAEGNETTASGPYSHAEGNNTTASGPYSHAEGYETTASGDCSHAEGNNTTASGVCSHAEGYKTTASGPLSHVEGTNTIANHKSQHVFGEYNVADTSTAVATAKGNYVEIVGNGTADNARSNARTLDWSGNEVLAGKLTMGAAPTANMDAATKQYVDNAVSGKQNTLTFDTTPTENSQNPVTSGGVYEAFSNFKGGILPQVVVTTEAGASVTATMGETTIGPVATDSDGVATLEVTGFGTWTFTAENGDVTATNTLYVDVVQRYALEIVFPLIYGASWDGSSTTKWTRTDAAAGFTDPVPYVAGASSYGSPFDDISPWKDMTVVDDSAAGKLVKIPKFYYKLTQSGSGMTVQISMTKEDGFVCSPMHMNRGDGKGERDVAYVGRYHCATSTYKSTSGVNPANNATRANMRTSIHNLGSTIWQFDFAARVTLWLLYIVEFADWNSQAKIGYGCGNNSGVQAMGYTDSMPYHTGTTQSSRTTYGLGTQYRNIEGLWDNVYDWFDGAYNNSNGLNIILNPANFSDSANGTCIGKPSSGWPGAFTISNAAGFPMFYASATGGSESTYSCDYWNFGTGSPCVCGGGGYGQVTSLGLFCVDYAGASSTGAGRGSRLQKLP